MTKQAAIGEVCPIPISQYPQVLLAHGGGGRLMHRLIEDMFVPAFSNPLLASRHDGAVFHVRTSRLAFTTDSYVVKPLFFPGGDIGSLAVNGTVNDLAMCGAKPLYLSVGFILEEGFEMEKLWHVVSSMKRTAESAGVQLVTGDTKVVDRGNGDGIFINTAGVGSVDAGVEIGPDKIVDGDAVIISGDLGRHGIAIMAAREGLEFESTIESDCAPLSNIVENLLSAGIEVHCLRDLTRGGLASALVEIAESSSVNIRIRETDIPVREDVRGACEILGFDPLYLANEGRMAAFVAEKDAERALKIINSDHAGTGAALIGKVERNGGNSVLLSSSIGATRIVDMFSGEQLPRIC